MDNTAPGVATENATRVNSRDAEKNSKEKLRESGIEKGNDIGVTTRTAPATADNTTIGDNADDIARQKSLDTDVEKQGLSAADDEQWLTGKKLLLAHTGFLLAVFCFALDQTIVATALPKLASEFQALDQLTWVVSAYFLTQAGLMLALGQVLTICPSKWVYLTCILIFEVGSLICGVAPSMNVLIFGRAFQGIGASGMFISILTIFAQIVKLETRPLLFASFGGVFAVSSVVGPLLGGVFTDHSTWRWCFYINLPFGAFSIAAVVFFIPSKPPPPSPLYEGKTTFQKWLALDWVGAFLSVGMITALLLPLQWGGVTKPWNDRVVIALFVVFAVLLILFVGWEVYMGKRAMMPLELFRRRTQVGGGIAMFFIMGTFLGATYYLPFFYQAKGRSPSQSGINIIPFMLAIVIASFLSGGAVNGTGHYKSMMVIGPLVAAVGAGLLYTIDEFTPNPKLIGYQIIFGFGLGLAFQLPVMAIQAEYADQPDLIPQGSSLLTFLQLLGGVVAIAICGTIVNNQLVKFLAQYASDLPPEVVQAVKQSVTAIFQLPEEQRQGVIRAYVQALVYVFVFCIPAAVLAGIAAMFVKNWNVKQRDRKSVV